jgi:multiple sugar transport system substrate-binding protein
MGRLVMEKGRLKGLTWDHPRGYRALEAAARRVPELLEWSRQPLEGFESHPIADLAARYDLLVIDHPHVGEIAREGCIRPLEEIFLAEEIEQWGQQSIGAALRSYQWDGRHYALPLDVAMQVAARDPDLVASAPDTWDEVLQLSNRIPTALSLAGPHALLAFYSICLALGEEPGSADLVSDVVALAALDMMRVLTANAPRGSETLNPIALLETIANRSGIAFVPLVFGYATYAAPSSRGLVGFSEAPRIAPGGRRGSVLGGTGIALVRRTVPSLALLDHLRWLMLEETQAGFIPAHAGQPSALSAWRDPSVNTASGEFYATTFETAMSAWIRPRFDGYIDFQNRASATIRDGLLNGVSAADTLKRLRTLWLSALDGARRDFNLIQGQLP